MRLVRLFLLVLGPPRAALAPAHNFPSAASNERGLTVRLEDTEDLVSGDALDLGDTVRVTEDDTDLGRGQALARELEDVVADLVGRDLQPARRGALVGERRSGCAQTSASCRRPRGESAAVPIPLWGLCLRRVRGQHAFERGGRHAARADGGTYMRPIVKGERLAGGRRLEGDDDGLAVVRRGCDGPQVHRIFVVNRREKATQRDLTSARPSGQLRGRCSCP